jgi:uncharacterized surface protein with fasciclin (FAS1) repeats
MVSNKNWKEKRNMIKKIALMTSVFLMGLAFAVVPVSAAGSASNTPSKDIVDTAVGAGSFTTLVQAVQAAGLVDVLKGDGPFTVFAPTDEAFAKLPAGTLESLLKDKAKLTAVLTYHVVPGKQMASDVVSVSELKTVQGQALKVAASDGVKIDDANVVKTDILCSNGVIHVIDSVVIPQ